jgi:ankyrin repeat protein
MPKPLLERLHTTLSGALYFVPALIAFCAAAFAEQRLSLALLLIADVMMMAALCRVLGFQRQSGFFHTLLLSGSAYLTLLAAYTVLVAVLIGYPLLALLHEGSLSATLAMSGAVVIALILLWRCWPAFGLVFVGKRLGANAARLARKQGLIRRSIGFAWSLTAENELFFSHGLIVAISLATLAQGALSLAGFDGPIPVRFRTSALAIYALIVAPLAHWIIATRCAEALLTECRRARREREREVSEIARQDIAEPAPVVVPSGLSAGELDTMLLRCIRAGQTELALAALARGADPNCVPAAEDRDQRTGLVLAAVSPDLRLLRGLIAQGGDLNRVVAGISPLIAATRDSHEGRPDAVMTLLTNGADPNGRDSTGNTPLHYAALAARPIVAALLCDSEAQLDAINRDGLSPLGVACAAANWDLARFLLDRGAKLEHEHAQPALLAAASIADDDAQGVKLLLKRRARVDACGPLARTALMTAALNGHADIAKALLDAGAQIDLVDAHGTTALMEAARSGAHAVLDTFAAHRPEVDRIDAHGRSALIIASQSKHACEDTISRLLAMGASCNQMSADGRRAVEFAAAAGRWKVVALLDPQYPLPATLKAKEEGTTATDSPAHLLDALRFAHWHIVDNFTERMRTWPQAERARLFTELATHADAAPRQWLLNHGLDASATLADGTPLLLDVLANLPESLPGVADLIAAGAQPAGGDSLVRLCAAGVAQVDLETLTLVMIERGAEVFAADKDGLTPLAHAVACGSLTLVQTMLARGLDPNVRDNHGRTPLFAALQLPSKLALAMVRALIGVGANPEIVATNGETPLGLALARPESELQHWLNWPLWKLPQRLLRSPDLVAAAGVGDVAAMDKLLALGLPIEVTDTQGATALMRAAGNGHAAAVAHLLEHGADAAHSASTGATALSAAVSACREHVVEALLTHGVAVDQRLPGGGTALMIAAALGFPELVAQLLTHGAQVNAEDERGMRALHAAAQYSFARGDSERAQRTLTLLLDAGAAVDAANTAGQTALLLLLGARAEAGAVADQRQLLALLSLLLKHRVDLNAQDQRGVSALHACAMHGLLLPARALLAAGADPARRDMLERTPRQIAHLLGFIDVAVELGASSAIPSAAQTLRQPARP